MLTATQKNVLKMLKGELIHGDIIQIAESSGFDRSYVGHCLNPEKATFYNEAIVTAATKHVAERKRIVQKQKDMVRSL